MVLRDGIKSIGVFVRTLSSLVRMKSVILTGCVLMRCGCIDTIRASQDC